MCCKPSTDPLPCCCCGPTCQGKGLCNIQCQLCYLIISGKGTMLSCDCLLFACAHYLYCCKRCSPLQRRGPRHAEHSRLYLVPQVRFLRQARISHEQWDDAAHLAKKWMSCLCQVKIQWTWLGAMLSECRVYEKVKIGETWLGAMLRSSSLNVIRLECFIVSTSTVCHLKKHCCSAVVHIQPRSQHAISTEIIPRPFTPKSARALTLELFSAKIIVMRLTLRVCPLPNYLSSLWPVLALVCSGVQFHVHKYESGAGGAS